MAESKTFAVGEILTAQDVNAHLVNHGPPGEPFDSGTFVMSNPGDWGGYGVNLRRVGMIVLMTINVQIVSGTPRPGTVCTVPEDMRPGFTPWEFTVHNNYDACQGRVNASGDVQLWWLETSTGWLRGSASWWISDS